MQIQKIDFPKSRLRKMLAQLII